MKNKDMTNQYELIRKQMRNVKSNIVDLMLRMKIYLKID